MMRNDKMIHLIEQELVQADEAQTEAEFEKHMYAIHTLTSLYTSSDNQTSVQDRHEASNAQVLSSQRKESNQIIIKIKCQLLKLKQWEVKYLNQ